MGKSLALKALPIRLYRDSQCQKCRHFSALATLGQMPVYCTAPTKPGGGKYYRCLVWCTEKVCTDFRVKT